MSCPRSGPCSPFAEVLDLCCVVTGSSGDPCLNGGDPVPQAIIDNALIAASEILWAGTGRQFGTCTVTIRPCRKTCAPCGDGTIDFFSIRDFGTGFGSYPWIPMHTEAGWINVSTDCGCNDCCSVCAIELPYPVCCVDEVTIDGIVLDPSEYRVDDFKHLVRTPAVSGVCWPECQNLTAPITEEDTFSVTVTYGREVPALVRMATAALACEFIKSCQGAPCQLPQRVQSISRQGVTVGFLDPMEFLQAGRTGIYLVDLAMKTYNPRNLLKQASVYSPDVGKRWRVTTGGDCG